MRSHANGLMQRHLQRVQSKRAVRCARPMTNVRINVSNAIGVRVWQDRPANWPRPGDCHEQRYGSKEDREEKAPEDIAGETCSQKGEEGEQEVNASPSHPCPLGAGISGLCVVCTHLLPRSVSGEATTPEGRNARHGRPGA